MEELKTAQYTRCLPKTLHDHHHLRYLLLRGLELDLLGLQLCGQFRVLLLTLPFCFLQLGLQYFTPIYQ